MSHIFHSKLDVMQTIPLLKWGLLVLRKHEKSFLKEAKTEIEPQLLGLASGFQLECHFHPRIYSFPVGGAKGFDSVCLLWQISTEGSRV